MKLVSAWFKRSLLLGLLLVAYGYPVDAQPQKKALSLEDYDRWRSIESTSISDDGNWITYRYHLNRADDTLYVKNLSTDTLFVIPRGTDPQFSDDARWVAYRIRLPYAAAQKRRKDKKPLYDQAQLMNLETGEQRTWDHVASFDFSKGSHHFVVKKTPPEPAPEHQGADLILRNLKLGYEELIGSVEAFSFNKPGALFAYTIDAADRDGNGLYLIDLAGGTRRPLDNDTLHYAQMTWDEEGTALAVLKGHKKKGFSERDNALVAFTGLDQEDPSRFAYRPDERGDFPEDTVLSERGSLAWRKDLSMVFVGIKAQAVVSEKEDDEPVANVDIFHWKDDRIQTVQMKRAEADRNFTYRSAIHLRQKRFLRLTDETMRTLSLTRDGLWGIGRDDRAYRSDWKETQADYYRVNTATGERTLLARAQKRTLGLSPDSKHFLYWKEGHVWLYNLEANQHRNLTASAPVRFVNEQFDRAGTKPPYGVAGWTSDGNAVLLHHRYDLWLQPLDGSPASNLTGGHGDQQEMRLRYLQLDPEAHFIDLTKPVLLSAYGEWTKKFGYFELIDGRLEQRLYEDRKFDRLTKAKNADKVLYTRSTFADFPDYYVSDTAFSYRRRVTEANPWQADYKWGRRILFEFANKDGVRLQATLALPDDYVAGQRLPMIVNFYAKKTQELHNYYAPMFGTSYPSGNIGPVAEFAAYVSNGYLVMQPDIHFNLGTTHDDMLDCVEAATRKVIEMGYADPARIALGGGSFSGGGSAYIATRSTMFVAIASRAAPINLAGEFNILFSGSGQNNHRYDIYGQGRYGTNPFDDFELYRSQSPITHVQTMNTPLLYLHGKKDGSVEYLQGMEFYNALRFLGKPIIFLSYPDEGHNLRAYENQKDFTRRLGQFFDHYLKDKPAPDWMVNGVPFLKKKK